MVSRCQKNDEVLFVDPLYDHLYLDRNGKAILEKSLREEWRESAERCSNPGILGYPIQQIQYRNPRIFLNRIVNLLDGKIFLDLTTFSFRKLMPSQHLFNFFFAMFVGAWTLILFIRNK